MEIGYGRQGESEPLLGWSTLGRFGRVTAEEQRSLRLPFQPDTAQNEQEPSRREVPSLDCRATHWSRSTHGKEPSSTHWMS